MSQNAITDAINGTTVSSLADAIEKSTQISMPTGNIIDPNAITIDRLAPNNYLTIVWRDKISGNIYSTYEDLATSQAEELEYTTRLNNAINNSLNNKNYNYIDNTKYVNVESIAKYLSQNILPSGTKRVVVNALIGMVTGNRSKVTNSAISLTVNVFGEIAKKVAHSMGFSDPHEAFASVVSENSIGFLAELGKQTKDKLQSFIRNKLHKAPSKINSTTSENRDIRYTGLLLGITMSDTESYEIIIPRRKVENGSDYTTHLLPQPFKKEFTVKLTNKVLSSRYDYEREIDNIEKVKNKLIEIANSYTTFDIYIRLSSEHMYKKSNVVFSSLSFTKDEGSGNGYECSFTIEPIEEFLTKTFISDRKYFPTVNKKGYTDEEIGYGGTTRGYGSRGNGNSKGNGSGGAVRKQSQYTANGGKLTFMTTEYARSSGDVHGSFSTVKQATDWVQKLNRTKGENYDVIHYLRHNENTPDLVAWSHSKMTYVNINGKNIMVPDKYTKKTIAVGFDNTPFASGRFKTVTKLRDDVTYDSKTGIFTTANGSTVFTVKGLQSSYNRGVSGSW